jgi:hypothetical protein
LNAIRWVSLEGWTKRLVDITFVSGEESVQFQTGSKSEAESLRSKIEASKRISLEVDPTSDKSARFKVGEGQQMATALYGFEADGEDELDVEPGERLTVVLQAMDDWWECRNSKGKMGTVPAAYLQASSQLSGVGGLYKRSIARRT